VHGCEGDIRQHCSGPGQNATKIFLCLMAYEEQLSPTCREGVLEAAKSIKAGSEATDYSLSACETDVDEYCRNVRPGEGRVVGCIKANEPQVRKACIAALKETGMWERAKESVCRLIGIDEAEGCDAASNRFRLRCVIMRAKETCRPGDQAGAIWGLPQGAQSVVIRVDAVWVSSIQCAMQ
jgi:hypothetical protein